MIATLTLATLLLAAPVEASPLGTGPDGAIRLVQDTPEAAPPQTASPAAPPAATQARPRPRRPVRRRTVRRAPPPPAEIEGPMPGGPSASTTVTPQADVAPMPNRDIEAPRGPVRPDVTTIRPDLIEPQRLPDARTQSGVNSFTDRQDRLYRDPAAGARLNIPFAY